MVRKEARGGGSRSANLHFLVNPYSRNFPMSRRDRNHICKIISDMLDTPLGGGIYPTSTAFIRLEHYIEAERTKALGWMHAEMCILLDNGKDPRVQEVAEILERALCELDHRDPPIDEDD